MLTATYAFITLSVEQKKTRNSLSDLQQQIQHNSEHLASLDGSSVETIFDKLVRFDEACYWRNMELYVVPALRSATNEANVLLAELDALSTSGGNILKSVREKLRSAYDLSPHRVKELCSSMEQYCQKLLQRLEKEEQELLPLAQRTIASDEWFEIGAQLISNEEGSHPHKPFLPNAWHASVRRSGSSHLTVDL